MIGKRIICLAHYSADVGCPTVAYFYLMVALHLPTVALWLPCGDPGCGDAPLGGLCTASLTILLYQTFFHNHSTWSMFTVWYCFSPAPHKQNINQRKNDPWKRWAKVPFHVALSTLYSWYWVLGARWNTGFTFQLPLSCMRCSSPAGQQPPQEPCKRLVSCRVPTRPHCCLNTAVDVGQRPYIRSAPFSPHKCPGFQEEEPVALAPAYHQYNRAAGSAPWQLIEANFGSLQCVVFRCSPMSAEGRRVTYYPDDGSIDRSQTIRRFFELFAQKTIWFEHRISKGICKDTKAIKPNGTEEKEQSV